MQNKILDKKIIVMYHGDCPDGFGGAWVAWKKFGDEAEYIGLHYDMPPPAGLENKEIYMIDFVYPVEIIKDLISRNIKLTAIDHHITNEEAVKLTNNYSYDLKHSGAVLAWKHFFHNQAVPKLLQHIEDRDLWKFSLSETVPILAFLESLDYDFNIWSDLIKDIEDDKKREVFIEKGLLLAEYREELIRRIWDENSKIGIFEGYEVYIVNGPHEFADRIGEISYNKKPPFAVIWSEDRGGIHVSLRSNESVDVSKIAEKYGGGGHKGSAGFRLELKANFPWKEIK